MYTDVDPDRVSPFQIARVSPEDEWGGTAKIVVLDPLEFRITVFEADTGLPMSAGFDTVSKRARELLEKEGGFIVHAVEPDGDGLAVVIEVPQETRVTAHASTSEIKPGEFSLVFDDVVADDEEPFSYQIRFTWDGERAASFMLDAAPEEGDPTFVGEINSDPTQGWVSWLNENDALIAFLHPLAEEEGWARVTGGAPGAGSEDPESALEEPQTWINLGKLIHAVVSNEPVPEMIRRTY